MKLTETLRLIPGYDPFAWRGDWWLDESAASQAIEFFPEILRHVEGDAKGSPFVLEPWEQAVVGNLFGWKRKDERGRVIRRFRKVLLYVARGNGKSPLASGIGLLVFVGDGEPGAQCYLAAGQRDQAAYMFRNMRGMVEQEPELSERIRIFGGDNNRCLVLRSDPLSFCKVMPADAKGQHGGIPHFVGLDELHVQESRDLLDVFETGMAKKVRAQPLLVMMTTADYDRPSVCNEVYAQAVAVRDNGGDPSKPGYDPYFLPVVYEVPQADDWRDERVWHKANPNLGVTVSLESLRGLCAKAVESPAFEGAFRRLHLNQRTGQEVKVIRMDQWDACGADFAIEELRSKPCFGGLDLASVEDIASFALLFPESNDKCKVLVWSWCPEERIARRARQKFPYDVWARAGWLTATKDGGGQIDYGAIRQKILELKSFFDIRESGYDAWNATQLVQDLEAAGMKMFKVPAHYSHLSAPTKELLRRIRKRTLHHRRDPVLRWAATNAAVKFDGTLPDGADIAEHLEKVAVMLSKKHSAEKIDPLTATVLAMSRLIAHPEVAKVSVYESRGLIQI